MKKEAILLVLFIFLIVNVSALSNESIQAEDLMNKAKNSIGEMIERNISVIRANETYQEALQMYLAQQSLEQAKKNAKYDLVIQYANSIISLKEAAFKSKDELRIFLETYDGARKSINLSEMDKSYNAVLNSFNEERFEDTIKLINIAYEELSEVQSSQTALNLFYSTTSKTVKNFFINQWKKILIISAIVLVLLLVSWKAISKFLVLRKIKFLETKKNVLNNLIQKVQGNYFKDKKASESEYRIKIKTFEEMIRDINRQIPLLKEEMFKIDKKTKSNLKAIK
ncbi:MAG: hypothetical protein KKB21_05690 [Nanoarchaeota archaeon]|nr:hypothetical protein [Nanoarchaeota archaeon]